ncbi:MAG: protein kinase [Bifidobacteriaceae bacterium]|nr:protein kinase [Bifidobacteriaceae bacterium]
MSDISVQDLQPGQIIGGYRLVSPLGGGGMGSVWRVHDGGGNTFAMKILHDTMPDGNTADSERERQLARERLRREGSALRRVNHPGVCRIVDMELDDRLAFIVTELIDGLNLAQDVEQNGRYEPVDLMHLSQRLIDAVDAVHAAGIIHRDIKPTNVMISDAGPVLVDFGIAMGEGENHVTRTGLVMGTPGFIAPEIIDGAEADEATDWWSVAAVLGFAGTGAPVFGTKPMMAVLEREASGHANLAGLSHRTEQAMRSALDPNRMKRCSAQELLQAITADASQAQPQESTVVPPSFPNTSQPGAQPTAQPGSAGVVPPFSISSSRSSGPRAHWRDREDTEVIPPDAQDWDPAAVYDEIEAPQIDELLNGDFIDGGTGDGESPAGERRPRTFRSDMPSAQAPCGSASADPYGADPGSDAAAADGDRTTAVMPQPPAEGAGSPFAREILAFPDDGSDSQAEDPEDADPKPMRTRRIESTTALPAPTSPTSPVPTQAEQPQAPAEAPQGDDAAKSFDPAQYVQTCTHQYTQYARIPAVLGGLFLAALAVSLPGLALILAPIALVILSTVGASLHARFAREARHGGHAGHSDNTWAVALLPVHILEGLALSALSVIVYVFFFLAACFLGTIATGQAEAADSAKTGFHWGTAAVIPVPVGDTAGSAGLAIFIAALVSWAAALLCVSAIAPLRHFTEYLEMGLGWTCFKRGANPDAPRRSMISLAIWSMLFAIVALAALADHAIDWTPFLVA